MPSGLGDSKLNQLEGKDDIEEDPVDLVQTRRRPHSNGRSHSTSYERQYLPGHLHPEAVGPSKTATKITMPMNMNPPKQKLQAFGPQPGNNLHTSPDRFYRNVAPRKRELSSSVQVPSSEQSRPRKQQKTISAIGEPSVDTDDEVMVDDPYSHRNQKVWEQQQTTREDKSQSRNISANHFPDNQDLTYQADTNPKKRAISKNRVADSSRMPNGGESINRADLDFVKQINDIAESTHTSTLKTNNPSKWSSGDTNHTKWTTYPVNSTPTRLRSRNAPKTKFNLLCFQHGVNSYNVDDDSRGLFIQLLADKTLATLYGEKGKEKEIWRIDLQDEAVSEVFVMTSQRKFAVILKQRSHEAGEPGRTVMFDLKTDEDTEDCKSKIFSERVGRTPKESDVKIFDKLTNHLKLWQDRQASQKPPPEPITPRQHQTRQEKKKISDISVEISARRSARNQVSKAEKTPSKRPRGSSTDEFEVSPRGMRSVKPKFELPRPRWKKSLVYPPTGPKREIIDYDDLNRLNSNEFLNDNIVNFYLRYIEVQLQKRNPELAKETYFLNTFFYERLTKRGEKGKREIDSVLKWTAKVDIFNTSYIVIPINESSHWYLAIICNLCNLERKMKDKVQNSPGCKSIDLECNGTLAEAKEDDQDVLSGNVLGSNESKLTFAMRGEKEQDVEIVETRDSLELMALDEEPRKGGGNPVNPNDIEVIELGDSPSQRLKQKVRGPKAKAKPLRKKGYMPPDTPSIIILDSMGHSTTNHMPTFKNLREYLAAEALNKRNLEITKDDIDAAYAKAPNQNNWYDCGLFLLHYVERFFDDPKEFAAMFLARENRIQEQGLWRKEEIGGMREKLFNLFIKLHAEQEAVEIEQKGFQKREKVNVNESKGQRVGEGKGPTQDAMVEGSTKNKDQGKSSASEYTVASKNVGFEKFTGELEDLITPGGCHQHGGKGIQANLALQVTDQLGIQPINQEEAPNTTSQPPNGVTLSFQDSRESEGVIT